MNQFVNIWHKIEENIGNYILENFVEFIRKVWMRMILNTFKFKYENHRD